MAQPLGALLADSESRSFVGRGGELALLESLVGPAGAARVVHVHGDAGVGKSAFLAAVGSTLAARGFEIFTVSATDGLDGYPFAAIGHLVDGVGADDPTTALAKVIASLTSLTPGSSAVLLVDDAHRDQLDGGPVLDELAVVEVPGHEGDSGRWDPAGIRRPRSRRSPCPCRP